MRAVGDPSSEHMALLAGLAFRETDARSNAIRVRDRTGWPIVTGFALYEQPGDGAPEEAAPQYVGLQHFWNATPRGLWADATPRPPHHTARILVESPKGERPPAPAYEAQATNPLVIVATEGLCNRLRATLSYRIVAHEQGRPLHVVWRKDDYCPGYFLDAFLPIPGVRFFKAPPEGRPLSSLHAAPDTHAAVKHTPNEAYSYAPLAPCDSVRAMIANEISRLGPHFGAIHVRRTDLFTAIPASQHTKDSEFDAWADALVPRVNERKGPQHVEGAKVFVATDNADTQARFRKQYGEAAMVHKPIKPSGNLRQTPLSDAVVDLFVSAAAPDGFMGSHYSSFSDAIRFLRAIQGRTGAMGAVQAAQAAAKAKAARGAGETARVSDDKRREEKRRATDQRQEESPLDEEELVIVSPSTIEAAKRAHERTHMQPPPSHEPMYSPPPTVPAARPRQPVARSSIEDPRGGGFEVTVGCS